MMSGYSDSVVAASTAEASAKAQPHLLRVLIVDDNAVNLAVLGKLLRKNFSHLLDSPPVAVDSALKALQLLQDNVYDLILMDIQMPFLSGVDCTRRIRQGIDGVLAANRQTTIVAVTTAVGTEPEALYRRSGFDGLIGKPVKSEAMTELLEPLLAAAREAAPSVETLTIKGQAVTPPLPVVPITGERCFFIPQSSGTDSANSTAPSITETRNFEALLKEQTRISLFRYGACAIARTNSAAGVSDRRRIRDYDIESSSSSPSIGSSDDEKVRRGADADVHETMAEDTDSSRVRSSSSGPSPKWSRAGRGHSITISQSGLNEQIHREMQAADMHVPSQRVRQRPQPARLSAPMLVFQRPSPDKALAGFDMTTEDATEDEEESFAVDEPLSPFSHFGNSGNGNMTSQLFASLQQRTQQQPSPSKSRSSPSAPFGSRWTGNVYGVTRRSSSMGGSASSGDSSSPGSGASSSRSGSLAMDFDGEGTTPLTTPDNESAHFALAPIDEHKVGSALDSLPSPLSSPHDEGKLEYPMVGRGGSATLPRKTSPWRPPLERQTATRDVVTVAKVLHDQFKDFRL
ncbi:hypothetical protein BCV69DRAFT_158350 [Microstroma glucosiphilum]|uniref:Response regulatory domain-containing protein n=1 Tax=Pseudomicrostroma glucosiphilum TaxID=1684307 RepID=A0A316U9G9_9BASI|nr:hypothetical protein BCV69DRAFT_158350 [Pseudomicrostroma glucosiphilum]PWN21880.1 hypothetical protein BCV69DRAFT_158350 [Pseudomicrostroma glucosiphilum]